MTQQLQGRFCSASERLAGFVRIPAEVQLDISVNEDRVRNVVAVDTWAGWLDVFALDDHGRPLALGGELQTRRYHGRIRATLRQATGAEIVLLAREGLIVA